MTEYLSLSQVLDLHRQQIGSFGGSAGLRDQGVLEAAVARPQMTFGGEDLYPDLPSKTAALMHSLVMNHPFVDGNKRAAFIDYVGFLKLNGFNLVASQPEAYRTMIDLAAGAMSEEEFAAWIQANIEVRPAP